MVRFQTEMSGTITRIFKHTAFDSLAGIERAAPSSYDIFSLTPTTPLFALPKEMWLKFALLLTIVGIFSGVSFLSIRFTNKKLIPVSLVASLVTLCVSVVAFAGAACLTMLRAGLLF
eukprot:gnl/Chilomastix_cuspidata/2181.p1 GENE.gnl/Chilomastix_cuspidata/2181~~gnl/Chilomastix_cuspidata/2181.p1  ORF type:complete len:117 (-),score=29.33 gnl/Chilomastix_cuspidata/2181:36-386(-)